MDEWFRRFSSATAEVVGRSYAFILAVSVIGVWAVVHVAGVGTGSMDPVGLYAECSTLGTIVILFVYLLTMASLPRYAWRRHRERFSVVRHVVLPLLGVAALVVPFVSLCTPGQPSPYDAFPFVALGVVVAAFVAGRVVVARRRRASEANGRAPHRCSAIRPRRSTGLGRRRSWRNPV